MTHGGGVFYVSFRPESNQWACKFIKIAAQVPMGTSGSLVLSIPVTVFKA